MPIPNPLRILLIDDNSDDRALALRELRREFPGLQAVEITASEGLAQALTAGGFDLTITDYQLHWTDGLVILSALKSRYPDRPVVMFTGTGNEEVAVAAMKAGLDDYVIKSPQHLHRLPQAVRTALERQRLHQERERVVAALRESEERYRMLFETTPVIIYALSTEGRFIALNQAFEQLTGWSRDEWLGRSFVEMLHPDDVAFAAQQFQQVLQGAGESNYSEMRVLSRAGVILNIEIIGVQQIVNGQVSNISGFAHDITARKRAEEALGQAEQRYRSLFEEAPV
ncbi:MAG: PAS domain S-box protein, partial [Chloroflexi bacterium]|nr:PAS domain S-box protein [Chloroflexota bacterium]